MKSRQMKAEEKAESILAITTFTRDSNSIERHPGTTTSNQLVGRVVFASELSSTSLNHDPHFFGTLFRLVFRTTHTATPLSFCVVSRSLKEGRTWRKRIRDDREGPTYQQLQHKKMVSQQSMCDFLVMIAVGICAYILATAGTKHSIYEKSSPESSTTTTMAVLDSNTGISFDRAHDFIISKNMQLLGLGTRKKAILNIYSVAVYGHKSIVKQWNGKDFPKSGELRCQKVLVDTKAPRAVLLKFNMRIGAEKIAEAVSAIPGATAESRLELQNMIVDGSGGKLLKNEEMTFEWKGLDQVTISARGKPIGTIKDKIIASGILGLYVGPKSVSPSLLSALQCR